MSYLQTSSQAA